MVAVGDRRQYPRRCRRLVLAATSTGSLMIPASPRVLRLIRQPTLILAGDDDPIIPLANARLMAALLPDARLHVQDFLLSVEPGARRAVQ